MSSEQGDCADCGAKPQSIGRDQVGSELLYLSMKRMDEPWLCKHCRIHI